MLLKFETNIFCFVAVLYLGFGFRLVENVRNNSIIFGFFLKFAMFKNNGLFLDSRFRTIYSIIDLIELFWKFRFVVRILDFGGLFAYLLIFLKPNLMLIIFFTMLNILQIIRNFVLLLRFIMVLRLN